jgi:HPt (histidine-containing phosphotransfer) domain-containing protein
MDLAPDSTLARLMSKPGTAKLVERFLAGLPQRVASIEQALAAKERDDLKTLAHQLKGAAGGYGFARISAAAAKLESALAAGGDDTAIAEQANALINLCANTRVAAA